MTGASRRLPAACSEDAKVEYRGDEETGHRCPHKAKGLLTYGSRLIIGIEPVATDYEAGTRTVTPSAVSPSLWIVGNGTHVMSALPAVCQKRAKPVARPEKTPPIRKHAALSPRKSERTAKKRPMRVKAKKKRDR